MKGDKGKKTILIALFVVILGVGAFQFMGGSEEAPKKATANKGAENKSSDTSSVTSNPIEKANAVASKANAATGETNSAMSPTTSNQEPNPNPVAGPASKKSEDESKMNDPHFRDLLAVAAMPPRDPFQVVAFEQPVETSNPPPQNTQTNPTPPRMANNRRPGPRITGIPPFDPGDVSALPGAENPLGGQFPQGGQGGTQLVQAPPLKLPSEPTYSVSGVILGNRPAAVITDDKGNQRLVSVGGSVDGDGKIIAIERGKVVVKRKGKTVTLTVGGSPNAK